MQVSINKRSYVPGENLEVSYEVEEGDLPFLDVSNISTNVLRASVARNDLVIGFGISPVIVGTNIKVSAIIPKKTDTGICFISSATFTGLNIETHQEETRTVQFEPIFFNIRPHIASPTSLTAIEAAIQTLEKQRSEFSNRAHTTDSAKEGGAQVVKFIVMIFAVGCLVHVRQQLEGYTISPTGGAIP